MPIIGALIVALQIIFAIHAVKNGKEPIWLWIILLAPGIGCAIYFITQFGPDAAQSRTARQAKQSLVKAVDPKRELRKRTEMLAISDSVDNRIALADECIEANMFEEAIELLSEKLTPVHADDPSIMERLAFAHFCNKSPEESLRILDELISKNPDYKSTEGHLLYARSLEALDRNEEACKEYDVLRSTYAGEEARVRYGLLLKKMGRTEHAAELFQESIRRANQAPGHYRKKEKEWLQIAKQQ
ncbi:MAG: hypothetical protein AAF387_14225 [Pseudomonadota bacterium]